MEAKNFAVSASQRWIVLIPLEASKSLSWPSRFHTG